MAQEKVGKASIHQNMFQMKKNKAAQTLILIIEKYSIYDAICKSKILTLNFLLL